MWIKEEVTADNFIWDVVWGEAKQTISNLIDEGISSEQIVNAIEDLFPSSEDNPVDVTEVNDYIAYQADDLYKYLGVDPYDELTSSKKPIKSSQAQLHTDNIANVVEKIEQDMANNNISADWYGDNEDAYIDVTQTNQTTGNKETWSFAIDFGSNKVYLVDPVGQELDSFSNDNEIYGIIKRALDGDYSTPNTARAQKKTIVLGH